MLAAEFPNDNPDLHEGTIWVCLDVTGLPVAERRRPAIVEAPPLPASPSPPRESGIFIVESFISLAEHEEEEEEIVVEELAPLGDVVEEIAAVEGEVEVAADPMPEPAPIVAVEPALVAGDRLAPVFTIAPPPPDDPWVVFVATLTDVALAQGAAAAAAELPKTLETDTIGQAWAAILRGTSEDWDAIGGSMLDEWAADTLARITGVDAQILKRELRSRGIAAFGLAA